MNCFVHRRLIYTKLGGFDTSITLLVDWDLIIQYTMRNNFVESDDITFFVENSERTNDNDFFRRPNCKVTDENILFISCYTIRDWSCHFISIDLLQFIEIKNQDWGGVWFANIQKKCIKTNKCFVVHKYHNIKSENRIKQREGGIEEWLLS